MCSGGGSFGRAFGAPSSTRRRRIAELAGFKGAFSASAPVDEFDA